MPRTDRIVATCFYVVIALMLPAAILVQALGA